MKILCISDATDTLIYSKNAPERYKDVDFVISSGDLPLRYYDYIQTVLKKDVIYVYGNHNLEDFDRAMGKGPAIGADFSSPGLVVPCSTITARASTARSR